MLPADSAFYAPGASAFDRYVQGWKAQYLTNSDGGAYSGEGPMPSPHSEADYESLLVSLRRNVGLPSSWSVGQTESYLRSTGWTPRTISSSDSFLADIGSLAAVAVGSVYGAGLLGIAASASADASAVALASGAETVTAAPATLMPAAVPESVGTLQGWGLVQTAPGVWSAAAEGGGLSSALSTLKTVSTVASSVNSVAKLVGAGAPSSPAPAIAPPSSSSTTLLVQPGSPPQLSTLLVPYRTAGIDQGAAAASAGAKGLPSSGLVVAGIAIAVVLVVVLKALKG